MMDDRYKNPVISNAVGTGKWKEGDVFQGIKSNWYWLSTTNTEFTDVALVANLIDGKVSISFEMNTNEVWLVRSG